MGRWNRAIVATLTLTTLATLWTGSTAHATPPPADTVSILTDALESLRAGDAAGYDDAADELVDGGHWLPSGGWDALDDRDDGSLSLVWLLLDAQGNDLLLFAYDLVAAERDVVATLDPESAVDLDFLDVIDADGEMLLEVIDHRGVGISTQLRGVLEPITGDVVTAAPPIARYDEAMSMVAGRLLREGYVVPPIPGLTPDDVVSEPLPPLAGQPVPGQPIPGEPMLDEPATETATVPETPTTMVAVEPVEPTDAESATPTAAPEATPAPTTPFDMSSSDDGGPDPALIALGIIAVLAVVLALFALRNNRHTGRLTDIAYTDALTGLSNRRRLDSDLVEETGRGERPTAVLMIDVDHFKKFNDDHGHATGDDVLRRVAQIIADNVRDCDIPYRYGGEEFSVLLPATDRNEAIAVGERVREAIERAQFPVSSGGTVSVTASIGLSDGPAQSVNDLVRRADEALYVAKDAGRNQLARG